MSILIKPIITEKATDQSELNNCFSFVVKKGANKIEVKGNNAHPLYVWLKQQTGKEPIWNFQKYIIGKDGEVIESGNHQDLLSQSGLYADLCKTSFLDESEESF